MSLPLRPAGSCQPANANTPPSHDPKHLRVRNALLELLRAYEDAHDLPRSIPTKFERGDAVKPEKREHHNR